MGDSYREFLQTQKGKKKGPLPAAYSLESIARARAKERATLRAEYFRVARRRFGKVVPGQIQMRLWRVHG